MQLVALGGIGKDGKDIESLPSLALFVFCSGASTHVQHPLAKYEIHLTFSASKKLLYKFKIMHKIVTVILWKFFQIIILSVVAMAVLIFITKLMGFRQISEMSIFLTMLSE